MLGATITGAAIGGAVGSVAGAFVDQAPLAASSGQTRIAQGPRLADLKLGASSEGTPLPRVYSRARLPGQLIWATRFEEEVVTTTQTTGGGGQSQDGKNFDGPSASSASGDMVKTTEYFYYANAAYAVCEGPITRIGRIWADGKELDHSGPTGFASRSPPAMSA